MSIAKTVDTETSGALTIPTVRFGAAEDVSITSAELFTFPDALPGLPDSHRYALVVDDQYEPLRWLQSLDETPVCLPLLPLEALDEPAYRQQMVENLRAESGSDSIVGIDAQPDKVVVLVARFDDAAGLLAVNLLAPVILDNVTGTGRQVVLDGPGRSDSEYGQQYPLRIHVSWDAEAKKFRPVC